MVVEKGHREKYFRIIRNKFQNRNNFFRTIEKILFRIEKKKIWNQKNRFVIGEKNYNKRNQESKSLPFRGLRCQKVILL